MRTEAALARPESDARRCKLLDAALAVFARFGFRKTSMDEVARAANVSRQGLYLHFSTKEELFRSAVEHTLDASLRAATSRLDDASLPLEAKLVRAFDEWFGRYVGMIGPGATDLSPVGDFPGSSEASDALVGPLVREHDKLFAEAITKAVRASGLMAAYKTSGLTARQLGETLQATARGLKHTSPSRAAFVEGMTVAVRAMCVPFRP